MGTEKNERPEPTKPDDEDMSPDERAEFEEEVVQSGDQRDDTDLKTPIVAPD